MKSSTPPTRPFVAVALISLSLAIIVCFVSNNLRDRYQSRTQNVSQQLALFAGESYSVGEQEAHWPPFRSRILFPALLALVIKLGIFPPEAWFVILRLATAFQAFLVFSGVSIKVLGASPKVAAFGSGWLALGLILTFNHGWEHPTDFPDVIFFSLLLGSSIRGWKAATLVTTVVASLNRQTAAFAGVLWLCLHGFGSRKEFRPAESAYAVFLVVASYVTSWLAKWVVGGDTEWGYLVNGYLTIEQFIEFLAHPWASGWPVLLVALVLPTALWVFANRGALTSIDKRILLAVGMTIGISSVIAFMAELRSVFLVPHVLATFVAVSAESRAQGSSASS